MISTKRETPTDRFTGAEFEQRVNDRCKELKKHRIADIERYGVDARRVGVDEKKRPIIIMRKSFPDFEGAINMDGVQTIFDAKACSGPSWNLSDYQHGGIKRLQVTKMYSRSDFGVPCFFLIHWNPRTFKRKAPEPSITYAFPVRREHPFWIDFERGEVISINRAHCAEYAMEVGWNVIGQARIPKPDIQLAFNWTLAELLKTRRTRTTVVSRNAW